MHAAISLLTHTTLKENENQGNYWCDMNDENKRREKRSAVKLLRAWRRLCADE